jgi:pyruvate/2-oxoglutarate/acetoin dehydrogenase E1 component
VAHVADRAVAYGMPGHTVDGMDTIASYEAVKEAVARARRGEGPSLVELVTYRYLGHSKSDKQVYRTKDEVKEWMERDPIPRYQNWLISHGYLGEAEGHVLKEKAETEIQNAIEYALVQPEPAISDLTKYVYYEEPEVLANPTRVLPRWIQETFGPQTPINPPPGTREISYAEALREAMALALDHDPQVFMLGEDIGAYGGAFGVTGDLVNRFGPERVRDTPISENNIAGTAIGAGMTGMRAIAEMQFMDFVTLSMEQIVLQGAKIRYMFGGKAHVSMVMRLPAGSGTGAAAQHSESLEAWFVNVPGVKVVMPSTPYDAKGLLLAAIADNNPIMFVESKLLYKSKGTVPDEPYIIPLGQADIKRSGTDLTIVAIGVMVPRALEAAAQLAKEGIEVEVIDPRTLKPYDEATITASVKKTGRLIVVHEAPLVGGFGGEIAAMIGQSEAFAYLEAPIVRLGGADVPVPYNRNLERAMVPQVENIVEAARKLVKYQI